MGHSEVESSFPRVLSPDCGLSGDGGALKGTGEDCTLPLLGCPPNISSSLLFLVPFAKGPGLAPLPFLSVCLWFTGNMPHSSYGFLNHDSIFTVILRASELPGPTG